jgi:WD40 repeat protein
MAIGAENGDIVVWSRPNGLYFSLRCVTHGHKAGAADPPCQHGGGAERAWGWACTRGHTAPVNAVWLKGVQHALSASDDMTIRLWDIATGTARVFTDVPHPHSDQITCFQASQPGARGG